MKSTLSVGSDLLMKRRNGSSKMKLRNRLARDLEGFGTLCKLRFSDMYTLRIRTIDLFLLVNMIDTFSPTLQSRHLDFALPGD